jgi:hypothetical protein
MLILEMLEYLIKDSQTKVITMYMEDRVNEVDGGGQERKSRKTYSRL